MSLYLGGYYWARNAGLFRGEVETFVPYGGTPSGEYEIKPIGYLSVAIRRGENATEVEYQEARERLRSNRTLSRQLWAIYWPLANLEKMFR